MGFSSLADLTNETITNGKRLVQSWNKLSSANTETGAMWYSYFTTAGNPSAGSYAGTTLAFQSCNDTTVGAVNLDGNKSPDTRHILSWDAVSPVATGNPAWLMLVDILGYYPVVQVNATLGVQTTNSTAGANALPNRQGSQDLGVGVMAFLECTTAMGAIASTVQLTYTNTAGSSGRVTSVSPQLQASGVTTAILNSGPPSTANVYGPFIPLQAGDLGITSVQSATFGGAVGQTGVTAIVLARPIATIPILTVNIAQCREFVMNPPLLPQVPDSACLAVLQYAGSGTGASSNYFGQLIMGWG